MITGDLFFKHPLKEYEEKIKNLFNEVNGANSFVRDCESSWLYNLDRGAQLCRMAHEVNPNILVFRYSCTPAWSDSAKSAGFAGDIPKPKGHRYLIDFIESPKLFDIIKSGNLLEIEKEFPFVEIYLEDPSKPKEKRKSMEELWEQHERRRELFWR